jgi:hypothetical protein
LIHHAEVASTAARVNEAADRARRVMHTRIKNNAPHDKTARRTPQKRVSAATKTQHNTTNHQKHQERIAYQLHDQHPKTTTQQNCVVIKPSDLDRILVLRGCDGKKELCGDIEHRH